MKWYERLFLGVVFFLAMGWVGWQQLDVAQSFARTASAEERLATAHASVAASGHISATWPHGPLTMGYTYPDVQPSSVDEFEARLGVMLDRWEPK